MVEKKEVKSKKVISKPKKIGPPRGGMMKRTLKELETIGIQLKDVFSMENMTLNLSWLKLIRLVNFNADTEVLKWNNTFEEALEIIELFLF